MEEEDLIQWQDVLDEVAAGRTADLACPFCREGKLAIEQGQGSRVSVSCPKCKKYIEGSIGSADY